MTFTAPLNLDNIKVRKSRVHLVGTELEGGWNKLPPNTNVIHDGSVRGMMHSDFIGELPSPPIELSALPRWMKQYYPTEVNATCGMHVHLSFKDAFIYQLLMDKRYPATVLDRTFKWATDKKLSKDHPIWGRLAGNCTYAQHKFYADIQANAKRKEFNRENEGHRYTVINYCWGRFQTLECRVLPMMSTWEEAVELVNFFVNTTDKTAIALATSKETPRKIKENSIIEEGDEYDEISMVL